MSYFQIPTYSYIFTIQFHDIVSKYRIVTRILHVGIWLFFSLGKKQQRLYLPHFFWFSSGDPEQKDPNHVCYISYMDDMGALWM